MNKTELIAGLRAHLADKEDIANEVAPALALMRYSLVELEKPTSGTGVDNTSLRNDLAAADSTIGKLQDIVRDREGYIYGLLAEVSMVPEVDEEPVESLEAAYALVPSILDDLQEKVSSLYSMWSEGPQDAADKDRFINAVCVLLDGEDLTLQGLWDLLESKAKHFSSLEQGIEQRDTMLAQADQRLLAIRAKLGIPEGAGGSVEQLELANIDLLMQQRQAAQDRLLVGRDEEPAEGTLETIIEQCLIKVGLNWEDAEELPRQIEYLKHHKPLAGWISDAVDLAHAVRGNLAPENRVMAKAAEAIILTAPGVSDG